MIIIGQKASQGKILQPIVIFPIILLFLGMVILAVPSVREFVYWEWVTFKNTTETYNNYLSKRPQGAYAEEAKLFHQARMEEEL